MLIDREVWNQDGGKLIMFHSPSRCLYPSKCCLLKIPPRKYTI